MLCTIYRVALTDVDVYNMKTKSWRVFNNMLSTRVGLSLWALNGKLTVFGGSRSATAPRGIEEYNGTAWTLLNKTLNNDHTYSAGVQVPYK